MLAGVVGGVDNVDLGDGVGVGEEQALKSPMIYVLERELR